MVRSVTNVLQDTMVLSVQSSVGKTVLMDVNARLVIVHPATGISGMMTVQEYVHRTAMVVVIAKMDIVLPARKVFIIMIAQRSAMITVLVDVILKLHIVQTAKRVSMVMTVQTRAIKTVMVDVIVRLPFVVPAKKVFMVAAARTHAMRTVMVEVIRQVESVTIVQKDFVVHCARIVVRDCALVVVIRTVEYVMAAPKVELAISVQFIADKTVQRTVSNPLGTVLDAKMASMVPSASYGDTTTVKIHSVTRLVERVENVWKAIMVLGVVVCVQLIVQEAAQNPVITVYPVTEACIMVDVNDFVSNVQWIVSVVCNNPYQRASIIIRMMTGIEGIPGFISPKVYLRHFQT